MELFAMWAPTIFFAFSSQRRLCRWRAPTSTEESVQMARSNFLLLRIAERSEAAPFFLRVQENMRIH